MITLLYKDDCFRKSQTLQTHISDEIVSSVFSQPLPDADVQVVVWLLHVKFEPLVPNRVLCKRGERN